MRKLIFALVGLLIASGSNEAFAKKNPPPSSTLPACDCSTPEKSEANSCCRN